MLLIDNRSFSYGLRALWERLPSVHFMAAGFFSMVDLLTRIKRSNHAGLKRAEIA